MRPIMGIETIVIKRPQNRNAASIVPHLMLCGL